MKSYIMSYFQRRKNSRKIHIAYNNIDIMLNKSKWNEENYIVIKNLKKNIQALKYDESVSKSDKEKMNDLHLFDDTDDYGNWLISLKELFRNELKGKMIMIPIPFQYPYCRVFVSLWEILLFFIAIYLIVNLGR